MGFFSEDMADMIEIFQGETQELVEELDGIVMSAAQNGGLDAEEVNRIFRIVHTTKSSAAMMDLSAMNELSHRLEDVFLLLRDGQKCEKQQWERLLELLDGYSDYVKEELEQMTEEDYRPKAADSQLKQIEALLQEMKGTSGEQEKPLPALDNGLTSQTETETTEKENFGNEVKNETAEIKKEEAGKNEKKETAICVRFQEHCQMENVRSFLLLKQIQGLCETVKSIPEDLNAADAGTQIHADGWKLVFTSCQTETVLTKLEHSPYVASVELLESAEPMESSESSAPVESPETVEPAAASQQPVSQEEKKPNVESGSETGMEEKAAVKKSPAAAHSGTASWEKLLNIQDVTREMVMSKTVLEEEMKQLYANVETLTDGGRDVSGRTLASLFSGMEDFCIRYARQLKELEQTVNTLTLTPVSSIVPQLSRIVRDICKQEGKKVNFQVQGEELELDKALMDAMNGPFLHLIRNAIDHGIESAKDRIRAGKPEKGTVLLQAESTGDTIIFRLSDDGSGMDDRRILEKAKEKNLLKRPEEEYSREELLRMILLPGFSTREKANSYSGRGVGMDVVRDAVERFRGTIIVESELGKGSTFIIQLPVSMTSVESICFEACGRIGLLPVRNIEAVYSEEQFAEHQITIENRSYFQLEEEAVPFVSVGEIFGENGQESDPAYYLIVNSFGRKVCLKTGAVIEMISAVEKALPEQFSRTYRHRTCIAGGVVLGNGQVGLMLNPECLVKWEEN